MATEVRHRRGTSAQLAAAVPAQSELIHNVETNRIHVGDGSTPGGHPVATLSDLDDVVDTKELISYAPQTLTPEQQEQARENIGAASRYNAVISSARIEHFRSGGFIYDVVTVKSPKLHTVRKEFAPGVAPDGVVTKLSARAMSQSTGYKIVINADGFRNADGSPGWENPLVRPIGLQISNGVLYQDWLPEEHRTQAIVMMSDGLLVEANKDDGISGAQWVANGAQWSVCWGAVCVRDGSPVDLTGSYVTDVPSARTLLGQKHNGDIIIVLVEGVSGTYGPTPNQCGSLMASMGCRIAYICDSGGSSQCWWKNAYAVPSSDVEDTHYPKERGLGSFIVIEPDVGVDDYDSGFVSLPVATDFTAMAGGNLPGAAPGLAVRQIGPEVKMMVRVQGTFVGNTPAQIGDAGALPIRYRYNINGPTRIAATTNGVRPAIVAVNPSGSVEARVADASNGSVIVGYGSWPAPFSGLPTKPATP